MMGGSSSSFAQLADLIEGDWAAVARPEQIAPSGDWVIWIVCAGRGWGKTRTGSEFIRSLAEAGTVGRLALVGPTAADVRDTMVEGESGLLAIAPNSNRPVYEPSKRRLIWPNGVQAALFSSEEPERLRGPNFGAAWCDELAAWRNAKATWDNLQFGLRLGKRPQQVVTTTPRPIKLLRELLKRASAGDGDVVVTRGSTFENRANLAASFFTQIVNLYAGSRLGRQELEAEMLEDVQGALWSRELIEENRRSKADVPAMRRIVVAIDPAVSVSESSDETGLVVAGLGVDDRGYLLEDASGKFSPIDWAREAIRLYRKWGADRIVAEVNQGGAMVEQTIRTVDANVSYRGIHAHRGKLIRAEPVAALSEQHRILHVGLYPELEDQLCTFAPGSSNSPDRLDAFCMSFTELMVDAANSTPGMIEYYRQEVERMGAANGPEPAMDLDMPGPVQMLAPEGASFVSGMSGNVYRPNADRIVFVREEDVIPLERVGFKKVKNEETTP